MMKPLRIACMLLAAILSMTACSKPFKTDAPMSSFVFSHSGMYTGLIYTLSAEKGEGGWLAGLSLLAGEREYSLKMTDEEAAKLAEIAEEHKLTGWNHFDKADRRALDGTSFELRIGYEDGQVVRASGSSAFPNGYGAAHEAILEYFGELMEKNGIENPL